jgi:hypothetical protein
MVNKIIKGFKKKVENQIRKRILSGEEQLMCNQIHTGYLVEEGWWNAFRAKKPFRNNNEPIPWVTYSFIHFIENRLNKDISVFEYGSGASTAFYAKRVKRVVAIEHDKEWYETIMKNVPENANIRLIGLSYDGNYCRAINGEKEKFDIVSVDGRDRINCVKNCLNQLSDCGIIILDDSERAQYQTALSFLKENGFKQLEFWGISPGLFYKKCTSVFYRERNCLNI